MNSFNAIAAATNKGGSLFIEALSKLLKSKREILTANQIREKLDLRLENWNKNIRLAKISGLAAKHGIAFGGRRRGTFYYHADYPDLAYTQVSSFQAKKSVGFLESELRRERTHNDLRAVVVPIHRQQSLLAEEVPHLKTNLEIKSTEDLRKIRRQARDVCLQAHEILLRRDRELMENLF